MVVIIADFVPGQISLVDSHWHLLLLVDGVVVECKVQTVVFIVPSSSLVAAVHGHSALMIVDILLLLSRWFCRFRLFDVV